MKRIIAFGLVVAMLLCAISALAGEVPDLTGKWKAEKVAMHRQDRGFIERSGHESYLVIKEQKGRLFHGEKKWKAADGKDHSEALNGVVTHKNEVLTSETTDGLCHGELISMDEMILYYLEPGKDAKTIMYEYKRVK